MCFILPTVDEECDYENTERPYGNVGLGHTHVVMSQSRLTGSLDKWATSALGGLEARKHEQGEDSTLADGRAVQRRRVCGSEAFERQREWRKEPLMGLWLNQEAYWLLKFKGLGSWVGHAGVTLQLRKVRKLSRRVYLTELSR